MNFTSPETRFIVLPETKDRMIVFLFVWAKHRNVTDGQTDREICRSYYNGLHCEHKDNLQREPIRPTK